MVCQVPVGYPGRDAESIDMLIWSSRNSKEEKKIWSSLVKQAWCDTIGNEVLAQEKRADEKEEHAEERII